MKAALQCSVRRRVGLAGLKALTVVGALGFLANATAQSVLIPSPVLPEPEAPRPTVTETNQVITATGVTVPPEVPLGPERPFKFGPVTLRPYAAYRFTYGTGILSGPGAEQSTAVQEIAPGIRLDLGPRWMLDYNPIFTFYSDPNFEDTLNHFINLAGTTTYYDWSFRLGQNCALTSQPQVETGTQTDRQLYATTFEADWEMNSEMSLELGFLQEIQSLSGFTNSIGSSQKWSTMDWLNVHWGPNLSAAVGLGAGYESVDVGSDMTFEQFRGRIAWRVAHKVNLSVNGGAELRQFLDSTAPDALNPVMGLSLDYRPFEPTILLLTADRTVSTAYFQDQFIENTRFAANLTQRLLRRYYLGLTGGYAITDYTDSQTGVAVGRTDNYAFFGVSLTARLLKRGSAGIFYSISRNSSSQDQFTFSSNQVGFQLDYRY